MDTDVLNNLISTAGSAFQSYQQNNSGFTPLGPSTFAGPNGQIITTNSPLGATSSSSIVTLAVLGAIFYFLFTALRK